MKSVRPDGNVLARPVGCPQAEYMIASKAAGEVPVCPGVIEVVMRIVGTTTMSRPIDRSWRERAARPDALSGPWQRGSGPRQQAPDPVQGQKLAQAWKRSRELDREREVSTANRWLVPPA